LRDYEFADPRIVRPTYHPGGPLEGRDMLLEVRFWGLRFRLGVRVSGVIDELRRVDGRDVRCGAGANPIIRLGFRLFGRREQIRFAKRACERMACLVSAGR
jgi:hypothetical protein